MPRELKQYIGTMRVILNVEDELEAQLAMDRLQRECMDYLDDEDGDEVLVTQIMPFTTDVPPEEVLNILKRARNALIKTRMKECYDLASAMDQQIFQLALMQDPTMPAAYDYGRMMSFVEAIFKRKEDPND